MSVVAKLPTGRPGQLLALAITLALLVLLWEAAVSPLLDLYAERADAVAVGGARLARAEALVRALPALRAEAKRATVAGPASSALLTGGTDAVAAATLQGRVQDIAAGAGTTLSSTEALAARQEGAYRRIALRVSLSATLPVLVKILQSLDESTPRMLVDDLQLHTSPIIIAQSHQSSPPLDASMTVVAYRLGRGSDDATASLAGGGDAP